MKKPSYLLLLTMFLSFAAMSSNSFAQSEPVLYFCERYDSDDGEVGVRDRYSTGPVTVMVKCDYALKLDDVSIQYDKYDDRTGKFEFYKKFSFDVDRDMSYIFFEQNDESDLIFDDEGFYRVFLLDEDDKTIASALIEIID
jgi:hypothetical protein